MPIQIQFRRGTYAQWVAADPVLADGEMAIQTDAGGGEQAMTLKIGDGATAWSSLAYGGLVGPTGPTGPHGTSVNNLDGGEAATNYGGIGATATGGNAQGI